MVAMIYMQGRRETHVNNRLRDSVGEGEGGMIWENSTETCILSYVKQIVSPGSMHETGCSGLLVLQWPWRMGWGGKWNGVQDEGTHVHPWLVHVNVWQKPPQYCKVTSLKLISNFFKGCCLSPSICGHLLHSCGKTTIPKKHLHYKAGSMKEDEEGFI